jgi:cold shock CspA family protein
MGLVGARVEFDLAENPYNGKPCAVNVSVLD